MPVLAGVAPRGEADVTTNANDDPTKETSMTPTRPHPTRKASPRPATPLRWTATAAALFLALAATSCTNVVESGDGIGAAQGALTTLDFHPVLVTTGSCGAHGFRPIDDAAECAGAVDQLLETREVAGRDDIVDNANPHGCSIRSVSDGEGVLLTSGFGDGTAEQLEEQECSHDIPCVCADDAPAPTVCRDGVFQPDPTKYFTIRSPNGRYLRDVVNPLHVGLLITPVEGDATDPYTQPANLLSMDLVASPSDERLQWRFEASGDGFHIINRRTGRRIRTTYVPVDYDLLPEGMRFATSSSPDVDPSSLSCRGTQVFIDHGGYSPRDTGNVTIDGSTVGPVAAPLVYGEPIIPGTEQRRTGCMKKSRSCTSVYGSDFEQVGRSLCGFLNRNHRLTCSRPLATPISTYVPQGWTIEEVEQFSRAVDFDPAPVTIDPIVSPGPMADSLATYGFMSADKLGSAGATILSKATIAANSAPLYGAMFSIAVNAAVDFGLNPTEPDPVADLALEIHQTLIKLEADIDARTRDLISNGLAQESTRVLGATLGERTRQFYTDRASERQNIFANELLDAEERKFLILRLSGDIADLANDLAVDLDPAFPTLGADPSEDDLRRVHFGMSFAKLAAVQEAIMLSEATLLDAHELPAFTCEEVVENTALETRVGILADKLQSAQDALIAYGLQSAAHRRNDSEEEFEFDARNFSYPIDAQIEFLDTIVEDTLLKCERLRDPDDSFAEHFEANTPVPPQE